jgi:uncharacterized membrane protein (UPF0182 family)
LAALFENDSGVGPEGLENIPDITAPVGTVEAETVSVEPTPATPAPANEVLADKSVTELAQLAADYYESAQQALQEGDWATYGTELDKLEEVLDVLVEVSQETVSP